MINANADSDAVFRPKRARPLIVGAIILLLGASMVFTTFHPTKPTPPEKATYNAILGGLLCLLGVWYASGPLFGRPRLTLTRSDVKVETLRGTRTADWNCIGAFEPIYYSTRVTGISAPITGRAVSRNLQGKKRFVVGNSFTTPIADIMAELNMRRARAIGSSHDPVAAGAAREADEQRYGVAGFSFPWVTYAILAILVAIFACEQIFAIEPNGPMMQVSARSQLALGGLNATAVLENGEWYRLFTAPLLHANFTHILFNGIAFLIAGYLLESLVGRAWFLAFFFVGALGGTLMSMVVNPNVLVSVGASGAIMGLFAAALTSSFRLPSGTKARSRIQVRSFRILIPSLLPLATSTAARGIDYGAHIGGALSGAALGFALLKTWPETSRLPTFRRVASAIAVIGVVLCVVGAVEVGELYPRYKVAAASFIPDKDLPKTLPDMQAQSAALAANYPGDPRSHVYRAVVMAAAKDNAGAEAELRIALTGAHDLQFILGPQPEALSRAMLAIVLFEEGKRDEAKETARAVCGSSPQPLKKQMNDDKLCD